jgi:hypothetical protein
MLASVRVVTVATVTREVRVVTVLDDKIVSQVGCVLSGDVRSS